ncbi:alpha/beta-hydrolase [Sistotremastrum suecicum HHB10207 ss-3]|uniref:Alpha/beta-hydrolase n=1 Tax=Sistotremastrum suecicum HHB10207 ss-3 TaxID=1314776 RepID=A0A166EQU1_9AGAM|nr:alpha/beta-hydrolase [Sistotremastrum suecicum HHB10207 ss-3]
MRLSLPRLIAKRSNESKKSLDVDDASLQLEQMYAAEKAVNFRWISRLLATKSSYVLSPKDVAPPCISHFLAQIIQFAQLAIGISSPDFLFRNLDLLSRPDFPLDKSLYDALGGSIFIESFIGDVAQLQGYTVYRPEQKQLVVAFSGTTTVRQALHDVNALRVHYNGSPPHCLVHSGFYSLYRGIKELAIRSLRNSVQKFHPETIVCTGHSMGGAIAYFLCLDLMRDTEELLGKDMNIIVAVFGCPRLGNPELASYWRSLAESYREKHGPRSLLEVSVKGYNDGVPALPPAFLGYVHVCTNPYFLCEGQIYCVPPSECEHTVFTVAKDENSNTGPSIFPRGGHNYYVQDLEKLGRCMEWIDVVSSGEAGWEERYKKKKAQWEKKWMNRGSRGT